jgi:hypothetical protein
MLVQAPIIFISSLVATLLGNSEIVRYDTVMVKAPWAVTQPIKQDDRKLKEQFAEYLLFNPHDISGAAKLVSGSDYGKIYAREQSWPNDPEVKLIQSELLAKNGAKHYIPSREVVIHSLWARSHAKTDSGFYLMENKDFVAATRLVAEIAGYISKNGAEGGIVDNTVLNQTIAITFVQPENKNKVDDKTIDITPIDDDKKSPILNGISFVA